MNELTLMYLVNLIVVIGGVGKGISLLVSVRDEIRDLKVNVGVKSPPSGLLGDVAGIQHEVRRHRDRLIELEVHAGQKIQDRT